MAEKTNSSGRRPEKRKPPVKRNADRSLKEMLKSAGYLDNKLEGYFLNNLIRKGSAFLRYSSTSAKIGISLGFLFAVFFLSSIVYFNPALRRNVTDILLLAAYLWLIFTVIITLLAIVIGFIITTIHKIVRGSAGKVNASFVSAVIISAAVFGYLSVWWIKASSGAGLSRTGIRDLIALVLIFALSFIFGKLIFFGALALLRRNQDEYQISKSLSLSRKHFIWAAASALLFFSFLFFLAGTDLMQPEKRVSSEYTIVYPKYKVRLVAIDGLDRTLLNRMMKLGKAPMFDRLIRSGAAGLLKIEGRFVPPVFWTTVATGVDPSVHGIADISARKFAGVKTSFQGTLGEPVLGSALMTLIPSSRSGGTLPITANLRRSKAFWNILTDKTLAAGVVNWWASWPCEKINGFEVSERFLYKLEKKEKLDKDIYPDDLFSKSGLDYDKIRSEFDVFYQKFFPNSFTDGLSNSNKKGINDAAWIDYFHMRLFVKLTDKYDVFLSGLYLPGADIIQNKLLGSAADLTLNDLQTSMEVLESYYMFLDELLTPVVEKSSGADYTLLFITPGRDIDIGSGKNAKADGFYIFNGPSVKINAASQPITSLDVTPTVLFLMGFPQSGDFKGRPVSALFEPDFVSKLNAAFIETFGDRVTDSSENVESNFSREVLEQLRSLGYIN